jgi:hypothetical protein
MYFDMVAGYAHSVFEPIAIRGTVAGWLAVTASTNVDGDINFCRFLQI